MLKYSSNILLIDGRTNFSDRASLGLHIILQLSQLFMTYYPINDPISHSHCSSPLLSPHTRVLSSLVKHLYLSTAPPPLPQSGIPQHSPPHSYQHISSVKITNLCVCNVAAEWQSDDETNSESEVYQVTSYNQPWVHWYGECYNCYNMLVIKIKAFNTFIT